MSGKHFYRFEYLKSEHWQNLRLEKLAAVDAKCERCGHRDLSNDVHHLRYRRLFDVKLDDLVVLCRECHDLVHRAIERFRDEIGCAGEKKTWRVTCFAVDCILRPRKPLDLAKVARQKAMQDPDVRRLFSELRKAGFFEPSKE